MAVQVRVIDAATTYERLDLTNEDMARVAAVVKVQQNSDPLDPSYVQMRACVRVET